MKKTLFIALLGIMAMGLVSCGDKEEVKTYFTVTFDADGERPCQRSKAWKKVRRLSLRRSNQ